MRGSKANSLHFLCSELTCPASAAAAAPNVPFTAASFALFCTRTTFHTELLLKTYITSPASRLVTREELLLHLRERTGSRNASNAVMIWNQRVFNAYSCIQLHTVAYTCIQMHIHAYRHAHLRTSLLICLRLLFLLLLWGWLVI